MFRKIHSKERDSTLFQELKNEFGPQFKSADLGVRAFMDRHAKTIFCSMILLILISFFLTFFVLKTDSTNPKENLKKELSAFPGGLGGELSALQNLSSKALQIAELKAEIERIISQDSISKEDSIYLEKAIEQLQYFTNPTRADEH